MADMITRYESFIGVSPLPQTGSPSFIHESFPAGATILSSSQRKKSKTNAGESKEPTWEKPSVPAISSRTEMPINAVVLPRLPFDNSTTSSLKNQSCSYVRKQKSYLRMKGFSVKNVYKLNRHRTSENAVFDKSMSMLDLSNRKSGIVNLPSLRTAEKTWTSKHTKSHTTPREEVWKPNESSKFGHGKYLYRSVRELDEELPIPGFTPRIGVKDNRLGNVLSAERMHALLEAEEPIIPRAFYTDAAVLSPKIDIYGPT